MHHQTAVAASHRIDRHQGRVREALVQIFHDDARGVQRQLAIHQSRYSVVRVQLGQLVRQVARVNLADIHANTLLRQDNTHLMAEHIVGTGKQRHYRTLIGSYSH